MILFASLAALAAAAAALAPPADYRERPASDEIIYFVLPDRFENGDPSNDRGGLTGDRLATGYDPAAKGFFHGGDLAGLTRRLDYLQGLGATQIWPAPTSNTKPLKTGRASGRERVCLYMYLSVVARSYTKIKT